MDAHHAPDDAHDRRGAPLVAVSALVPGLARHGEVILPKTGAPGVLVALGQGRQDGAAVIDHCTNSFHMVIAYGSCESDNRFSDTREVYSFTNGLKIRQRSYTTGCNRWNVDCRK